ncbi:MAG: hypothetical protein ICV84_03995 [Flavisolibacter sp.]|nr:hypothetical protein [Flavisolibacter sp.]
MTNEVMIRLSACCSTFFQVKRYGKVRLEVVLVQGSRAIGADRQIGYSMQ